jgi:hypothetical protein
MNVHQSIFAQKYLDVFLNCTNLYLGKSQSIWEKEELVLMAENAGLIEPSFRDAIAMIAAAVELPESQQRHWTTSLRQFAKSMNRPLEVIPARYSAVRNDLSKWHVAPSGLTPKTVMNHRSNVKRALLFLSQEKGIPEHGAPLTAEMGGIAGPS